MTELALRKQRERRKRDGNAATHRYEKTINGFLMRAYRNMKSRVTGVQWKKARLYKGLSLLEKSVFYQWAANDDNFLQLFQPWEASGYARCLTPSVDRIDSSRGYDLDNIRFLTHAENSKLGSLSRRQKQSA